MASFTLKNLPDDLLRALRRAAEDDRRSLTQEIIHLLESALRGRPKRVSDVETQVAEWRELAGRWVSDVDGATEVARVLDA